MIGIGIQCVYGIRYTVYGIWYMVYDIPSTVEIIFQKLCYYEKGTVDVYSYSYSYGDGDSDSDA